MNDKLVPEYGHPERRPRGLTGGGIGALCGAFLTLPALLLAFISAGAGHGHYTFARLLFPIPMLATLLTNNQISNTLIVAAILQFPFYGLIVGFGIGRRKMLPVVAVVFAHVAGVVGCFLNLIPNFS